MHGREGFWSSVALPVVTCGNCDCSRKRHAEAPLHLAVTFRPTSFMSGAGMLSYLITRGDVVEFLSRGSDDSFLEAAERAARVTASSLEVGGVGSETKFAAVVMPCGCGAIAGSLLRAVGSLRCSGQLL